MSGLTSHPGFFSLKTYAAAIFALGIAFWQGLEFPYWAMTCVYILAQPLSGGLRLKGLHMVLGSLVGSVLGICIAGLFATSMTVELVALTVALMVVVYGSLRQRRAHFYVYLLSGITCMLVAMPGVTTPDATFMRAVDRVEDVVVGVCSLIFVDALVFPQSGVARAATVTRRWLVDLAQISAQTLRGHPIDQRLQADVIQQTIQFTSLRDGMPYEGSSHSGSRAHVLLAIATRGARLVPVLSALYDFDRNFGPEALHPDDVETRELLAQWIDSGCPDDARSAELRMRLRARVVTPQSDQVAALRLCYRRYLRGLYAGWRFIQFDHAQLDRVPPAPVRVPWGARPTPSTVGHVDARFALRGALSVGVHMLLMGCLWGATGWDSPMGFGMLLSAAFCAVSGMADDPLLMLRATTKIVGIAMLVVTAYVLVVLPAVSGFAVLALALFPALFLLGIKLLEQGTVLFAILPMALLRLGAAGPGVTLESLLNNVLAMYIGIGSAVIAKILVQRLPLSVVIRRLRLLNLSELLKLIGDRHADSRRYGWDALDRFLLIQTRLPQLAAIFPGHEARPGLQTLRELRIGAGVGALRRWHGGTVLLAPLWPVLQDALRRWLDPSASPLTPPLAAMLEGALRDALARPAGSTSAVRALVELRVALDAMNHSADQEPR
ncbi:FUSC family protein [Burkholderia cepacia]|uniref:FUSC family protein n=1 Tax=Burkholderia cepacia TaxID=292 RepID=UPI002AB62871|nr:FUSC family protein [Burkholderia cepacia]